MHQARQVRGEEGVEEQDPVRTGGGSGLKSRTPHLSPHPLQGKVLLITLRGQTITRKLQLQGYMGEQDQELLKDREIRSGSHPESTFTPKCPTFRPGETYPKHHNKVKLLPGLHHMDFQRLFFLDVKLRDWVRS